MQYPRSVGLALALLGSGGCACTPELPDDDDNSSTESEQTETEATATETEDTYEPPCDVPEVEPNDNAGSATPLPLDRVGCGAIDEELDLDYFGFTLTEDDWISVRIDAYSLASRADVALTLTSDGGESAVLYDSLGTTDVELVFPALADDYYALVTEQNAEGSAYHDYEVLVSVAKEPLTWETEETDNESFAGAMFLTDGITVFGWLSDDDDADWYAIEIPPGKHSVVVDTQAWRYGSAGNFEFTVYDEEQDTLFRIDDDGGRGVDPVLDETSEGDETWYFRIKDEHGQGGRAYWYVLDVSVTGEE